MKIIINEQAFKAITQDFDESFRFYKDGSFRWKDDKKSEGFYTSMVTKDTDGKVRFTASDMTLPKSKVISHNLYNITKTNAFDITKALKHGQKIVNVTSDDDEKKKKSKQVPINLIPHKSIPEFKEYVGKYILRYLSFIHKDIDVILTPQSSSKFNEDIANIIKSQYKEIYDKDNVTVYPNAFIKTPENVKLDIEYGTPYMKKDINALYYGETEDKIEKILQNAIKDVYDLAQIWQTEGKIDKYIKKVHELKNQQKTIQADRDKIPPCKQRRVDEIQDEINLIINLLQKTTPPDILKKTKYFYYGGLRNEPKPFQIKGLPDGVRKSIYNIYTLSQQLDKCPSFVRKSGETIKLNISLIETLKSKNKTILIFDDNISSGRTMDDAALFLINNGINKDNIVIITLGLVPASTYAKYSNFYRL